MSQNLTLSYGAPRKTLYLNRRHVGIIPAGVYSGYEVVPTTPASLSLTVSAGKLITAEGVTVEETVDLLSAVTIVPDDGLPRIDLVVAEHVYSMSNEPQTYAVIQGTAGNPPLPPAVPANSVKLAEVYVPAMATTITEGLIQNATPANVNCGLLGRANLVELLVEPASESGSGLSDKAFVHGGVILASSGTSAVTVLDQETPAFDPIASGAGYERWDLVTVDDNGDVDIVKGVEDIGSGAAIPPPYPDDKQVVAEVLINEQGTALDPVLIKSDDIRDVRFFLNLGGAGSALASIDHEEFTCTTGQTVFDLTAFSYTPSQNQLWVYYGGVLMRSGASADYVETSGSRFTFNSPRRSGVPVVARRVGTESGSS